MPSRTIAGGGNSNPQLQDKGDLESPFLQEEPFSGETGKAWTAHLGALEAESPFLRGFERDRPGVPDPEEPEEPESLEEALLPRPMQTELPQHRSLPPSPVSPVCLPALQQLRVAVVGAGLGGLMAGLRLAMHGVQVTVFEARPEVGGRVRSNLGRFSNGRIMEEGAELIGSFHTTWLSLARDYGIAMVNRMSNLEYERERLEVKLTLDKPLSMKEIKRLEDGMKSVLKKITFTANEITNKDRPWEKDTLGRARKYDQMSVADALRTKYGVNPNRRPGDPRREQDARLWKMLQWKLVNDEVAPLEQMNFLGLLCKVKGGQGERFLFDDSHPNGYWEELEIFRCANGCQTLANKMAGDIAGRSRQRPLTSTAVREVVLTQGGVRLKISDVTWDERDLKSVVKSMGPVRAANKDGYHYVIFAIPPSVWGHVKIFQQETPVDLRARIGQMSMGPAVKCFSEVHRRFWIEEGAAPSGGSLTLGQIWEGTDNQTQIDGQGILLNVFAGPILPGGATPTQNAIENELEQIYRGYRGTQPRVHFVDWPTEPFIETGYWTPKPGEIFKVGKALNEVFLNRLFFAGEHTQMAFFGYMEGALRSGLYAADLLLKQACEQLKKPGLQGITAGAGPSRARTSAESEFGDEAFEEDAEPEMAEEDSFAFGADEAWDQPSGEEESEDERLWDGALEQYAPEKQELLEEEALEPGGEGGEASTEDLAEETEDLAIMGEEENGRALAHMAFDHILLESLDPATSAMVPGVVPATPAVLTTPFFDAAVAGVVPDPTLQQALTNLVYSKRAYKSASSDIAVSLVDLSGANKQSPKYAGFNDLTNFYGGSVNKITGLLGVYQLLAEANELLKAKPTISDAAELESELNQRWTQVGIAARHHPLVAMILSVQPGSPPAARIRPELVARLNRISKGNENGSTPIVLLKFPYLGSTLLAHGLFSPKNGSGLWTRRAYGDITYLGQKLSISLWSSKENPHPRTAVHNINAVSVAQFYTLAAQHRMIDAATSKAVLRHLQSGGCTTEIDVGALFSSGEVSTKCGIYGGWVHNTLHFKETATLREFVVVILTKNNTFGIMKDLFRDLVALVP